MRPRLPRSLLAGAIAAVLCVAHPVASAQAGGGADPDTLKGAFIYNFTRYATWSTPGAPGFVLCSTERNALRGQLASLNGRPVGAQTIEVRQGVEPGAVRQCHMLFVGQADSRRLFDYLRAVRGAPVLTVSDIADSAGSGVAIELVEADQRMRLAVNPQASEQAGIALGAQLLRLALAVY